MDFPIHIDTKSRQLSILHFNGLSVKISMKRCISVPKECFYLIANSADPDEIPP